MTPQTTQERIDEMLERLDKAHDLKEAEIDALQKESDLLWAARSMLASLDITLGRLREQLGIKP